jgi:phage/plasmid-associated DNA primase
MGSNEGGAMTTPQPPDGGQHQQQGQAWPQGPQPGIAPVIPIGPQAPPGQWHIDPVTGQPVQGPAPAAPPWPPDPRPRAPWKRKDEDKMPASGQLAEMPADHPVRWLLVPGKDGIDLHMTQLRMPPDDMLAADLISMMADGQFRRIVQTGTWHYWNGRYHPADADDFMRRVVQEFARTYQEALRLIEAQVKETATAEALKARAAAEAKGLDAAGVVEATDKRFEQVMKKAADFLSPQFKYGKQLLNDPVQERVSKQLAKMLGTDGSEYDRDKTLVNFADGTFELATGTKREHRHADKLTSCLDYPFVQGDWEKLLDACPKYIAVMMRLSGGDHGLFWYNLGVESLGLIRGNPGEFLFFRCGGSNMGKSLCNTITGTLAGDRWYPAPVEMIGTPENKASYRHSSVLNTLQGMTYVTVDETDGDLVLNAGTLKMLASSKFMPTTELYRSKQHRLPRDWTFVGNANDGQMPQIPRLDTGLERRIRVIPVPPADTAGTALTDSYHEVIIAEEGAAIASLLVRAAAGVLASGLAEPPAVTQATQDYLDACDPRRAWLRARIGSAPGSAISSTSVWEAFRRETGNVWVTQTDFSLFVRSRGYDIRKDGRGHMMIQHAKWL